MSGASDRTADTFDANASCYTDPAALREQVRIYTDESIRISDPQLKRAYAGAAFALAQLAECIERLTTPE